jgi:hypothetical protein
VPAGRLCAVLLCAICLLPSVVAATDPSTGLVASEFPDPEQAERWNEIWDELAANSIDPRIATLSELLLVPGIDEEQAREIIRHAQSSVDNDSPPSASPTSTTRPPVLNLRMRAISDHIPSYGKWRDTGAYTRLTISPNHQWTGGVLLERDKGEPNAIDHVAWSIGRKSDDDRLAVVVGNTKAHVGTGLLQSSSRIGWINLSMFRPRQPVVAPSLTTSESGEFRGVAAQYRGTNLDIIALISRSGWDATVDDSGTVTRLRTDGIHISSAEHAAKNSVHETYAITRVGLHRANIWTGISAATSGFSRHITPFNGTPENRYTWLGTDISYDTDQARVSTELVRERGGKSGAAGSARYRHSHIEFILAGWHYDDGLLLPHGSGWSFRGEPVGERAIAGGVRLRHGRIEAEAFGARYRQVNASRSDTQPRQGRWEQYECRFRLSRDLTFATRWRDRRTDRPGLGSLESDRRRELRGAVTLFIDDIRIRSRLDIIRETPSANGQLGGIDMSATWHTMRMRIHAAAYREHGAPLYLYELRAPAYGYVRALYGTGATYGCNIGAPVGLTHFSVGAGFVSRRGRGTDGTVTLNLDVRIH